MSRIDESPIVLHSSCAEQRDIVSPDQYELSKVSARQRLTPLDMNMPRLYGMRWILCFPLSPNADRFKIYDDLKAGLAYTISEIPWICGEVGLEEGSDPRNNRIQVVEGLGGVRLKYNDLTMVSNKFPTYAHLKKLHFPLSELPTAQLSPLGVMPQGAQPVMAAQANFIEGGLLLTVGAHHSVSDGIGLSNILDVWAKNTSAVSASTSFTKVDPASNDRSHLMTGLPGATLSDCPEYVLAPTPPTTASDVNTHQMATTPTALPSMTARIFYFSPSSLSSLKIAASAHSTNDALYAVLWRHITLARNPLQNTDVNTTDYATSPQNTALLYAVNIRPRVSPPLPSTYLGNASMAGITERLPISMLTSPLSLTVAAAALRASINAFNTPNRVRLVLGLLASRPDTTDYKFAYNGFLGPDLSATTWADFGAYEMEWGSLGKPECFRIPGEGMDGSIIVLPRVNGGGLEVAVGLEDGAMSWLMKDEEFLKFAEVWA